MAIKVLNYITVDDVCERYKVTRQTVWAWRKKGLPFIKMNRMIRFDPEAVEKWIKENL